MDFYSADWHIGDNNILTYEHRPFKDLDEMEHIIVCNHNNTVSDGDTSYLLGDIGDIRVLSKLKGRIVVVCGNHDNYDELREMYPDMEIIRYPIFHNNTWLSHEPLGYMPPEIPYLNIHGHLHRFNYGLLERDWASGNRYFCVSMEQIGYTPISREEIKRRIKYN